jgi:hypothetical protein
LALPLLMLLGAAAAVPSHPDRFTADGRFRPPADYREWVFLSSGLDMAYTDNPAATGHAVFDNVFVDPASWAAFKRSGHWPDKTVFILENRLGATKGSINQQGHFQSSEVLGIEAHVRDTTRFKDGWGFFALHGEQPAELIPQTAACYACHEAHGAVDTTFTQFYPTARPVAAKAGTLLDR